MRNSRWAAAWVVVLCGSMVPARTAGAASLDSNLNRLFETWRERNYPYYDACTAWRVSLDDSQRMVFLTITHRLTTARLMPVNVSPNAVYLPLAQAYAPDGGNLLDHVTAVYAINGGHGPFRGNGAGSCGGGNNNRLFMAMDYDLWLGLCLAHATSGSVGNPGPLQDPWGGRSWRSSQDRAGAHEPFTVSDETNYGRRAARCTSGGRARTRSRPRSWSRPSRPTRPSTGPASRATPTRTCSRWTRTTT